MLLQNDDSCEEELLTSDEEIPDESIAVTSPTTC